MEEAAKQADNQKDGKQTTEKLKHCYYMKLQRVLNMLSQIVVILIRRIVYSIVILNPIKDLILAREQRTLQSKASHSEAWEPNCESCKLGGQRSFESSGWVSSQVFV
jgi:hypothetical protein